MKWDVVLGAVVHLNVILVLCDIAAEYGNTSEKAVLDCKAGCPNHHVSGSDMKEKQKNLLAQCTPMSWLSLFCIGIDTILVTSENCPNIGTPFSCKVKRVAGSGNCLKHKVARYSCKDRHGGAADTLMCPCICS
jgi:hypothetical protein